MAESNRNRIRPPEAHHDAPSSSSGGPILPIAGDSNWICPGYSTRLNVLPNNAVFAAVPVTQADRGVVTLRGAFKPQDGAEANATSGACEAASGLNQRPARSVGSRWLRPVVARPILDRPHGRPATALKLYRHGGLMTPGATQRARRLRRRRLSRSCAGGAFPGDHRATPVGIRGCRSRTPSVAAH